MVTSHSCYGVHSKFNVFDLSWLKHVCPKVATVAACLCFLLSCVECLLCSSASVITFSVSLLVLALVICLLGYFLFFLDILFSFFVGLLVGSGWLWLRRWSGLSFNQMVGCLISGSCSLHAWVSLGKTLAPDESIGLWFCVIDRKSLRAWNKLCSHVHHVSCPLCHCGFVLFFGFLFLLDFV